MRTLSPLSTLAEADEEAAKDEGVEALEAAGDEAAISCALFRHAHSWLV